jgi:hypothetical protein
VSRPLVEVLGPVARPREWVGCVVGVRFGETAGASHIGVDTIVRAWRGSRSGRLRRVELRHHGRCEVLAWYRTAEAMRVLVLGGAS